MKTMLDSLALRRGRRWDSFASVTKRNLGGRVVAAERGFHFAEMGDRGCIEKRETHGECAGGEFEGGEGIADYAGGCFEAALPAGVSGIANQQALRGQAGGNQHGAADALKLRPARSDADQVGGMLGQ